jgi:hypothetical protein
VGFTGGGGAAVDVTGAASPGGLVVRDVDGDPINPLTPPGIVDDAPPGTGRRFVEEVPPEFEGGPPGIVADAPPGTGVADVPPGTAVADAPPGTAVENTGTVAELATLAPPSGGIDPPDCAACGSDVGKFGGKVERVPFHPVDNSGVGAGEM